MSSLEHAARELRKAVEVKGRRPDYHDAQVERLRREWPTLWRAILLVLEADESLI